MALYGAKRDISLFRHINRELIGNVISQECVYYKFKTDETKVNLYIVPCWPKQGRVTHFCTLLY